MFARRYPTDTAGYPVRNKVSLAPGLTRVYPTAILSRMDLSAQRFGDALRDTRKLAGLSQGGLAALAGMNKETVMRIERGLDARVTTIGKLRQVLPGLAGAARNEAADTPMALELNDLAARIGHLVQGFISQERLHKVRAYVLQQLSEEQHELLSASALHLNLVQQRAEQRLVERGARNRKKSPRRRANGKSESGH